MPKFSNAPARGPLGAITTVSEVPDTRTYNLGPGFTRDAKSELFLLAVTNMVSEPTFYEKAHDRDDRFRKLVHHVTTEDPAWVALFVPYLRDEMNMRSASIVVACEYVKAGGPRGRAVINSACMRADEPAEVLGYWLSRYGKPIPKPVKRGVADAVARIYTERTAFKYDGQSRGIRMADVIQLVHPSPRADWQSDLFKYLLDRRYGTVSETPESLSGLRAIEVLQRVPEESRREFLRGGGLHEFVTWEWLSGWLPGGMDAEAWESVIPQMGYMALLRNLRNFDQAGISATTRDYVKQRLSDPTAVANSRQFPLRFLSAWKELNTLHWGETLEDAVQLSVSNVPELRGRTLVLWDCSGSMRSGVSGRSKAERWETAGIFALAVAQRSEEANLYAYSNDAKPLDHQGSVLRTLLEVGGTPGASWYDRNGGMPGLWGGTNTFGTLQKTFKGHDRVVIVTDEQADRGFNSEFLSRVPLIYTFNLAGYRPGHLPSGSQGRYTFGGLTDAGFRAMALLESNKDAGFPF